LLLLSIRGQNTRKFLFILIAVGLCLSLMGSALAYFDDTEASTDNSFEVGTWAIDADGGGNTAALTIEEPNPGASGAKTWAVTNTGTVPAYVDMSVSVSVSGNVTMVDYVLVHLYVAGYAGSIYGSDGSFLPISGAAGAYDTNLALGPGASLGVALDWNVSDAYVPEAGDKLIITINLDIKPTP
jgi:predicted ribosomally synthesized peptide with SipW-like signal peptide